MREIRFRGKRTDNGEWVYGDLIRHYENQRRFIACDQLAFTYSECGINRLVTERFCEVIPETVGQFTGLKDKNGKEIYGGDIVLCKIHDKEYMGLVEYTNTYGFYYLSGMGRSDTELWGCNERKVIGNIYENPELMEMER